MSGIAHSDPTIDVLLVEDNPADARFVRMALTGSTHSKFAVTESVRLADALRTLETRAFDLILLDLGLPDSLGLATFSVLYARSRLVPIVVVSALADEATMLDAVRLGAQDYLIKGDFDAALLVRVLRHAMERHQLLQRLERSLANVRRLFQAIEGSAHRNDPGVALAMCSVCKRLRAASGRWETIEQYLAPQVETQLVYEPCPDCVSQIDDEARTFHPPDASHL
jgi:PleD family two-component response regulator